MRITTWNCQGAFRKKEKAIRSLSPDLVIIQECESLAKINTDLLQGLELQWFGDQSKKGIGVGVYSNFQISPYPDYDPSIHYCVPLIVSGIVRFHLLAIWAMNDADPSKSYVRQVYRAMERYSGFITESDCILMGDFNSNRIFDRGSRIVNHTSVVDALKELGIVSAYHHFFDEEQGVESRSTFYLYRKQTHGFHIDYCFIPERWTSHILSVTVGDYAEWIALSDHSPLTVDLALSQSC